VQPALSTQVAIEQVPTPAESNMHVPALFALQSASSEQSHVPSVAPLAFEKSTAGIGVTKVPSETPPPIMPSIQRAPSTRQRSSLSSACSLPCDVPRGQVNVPSEQAVRKIWLNSGPLGVLAHDVRRQAGHGGIADVSLELGDTLSIIAGMV
jgi:hypothetical protein